MAVIKAVSSHAGIKRALDYVMKDEKTERRLLDGFNCNPDSVREEMQLTKQLYRKTGGRTYKHFVQSFAPEEEITPELANKIAGELAQRLPLLQDYQAFPLWCTSSLAAKSSRRIPVPPGMPDRFCRLS